MITMMVRAIQIFVVALGIMVSSTGMAQMTITLNIPAQANPNVYNDTQRSTFVASYIFENGGFATLNLGDVIIARFSDGYSQRFQVTGTENNKVISVVPNTLVLMTTAEVPSCAGGAAQAAFGYGGSGTPLYRATYECEGDICRLQSAVLIGVINATPVSQEAVVDAGGWCQAII